jgi:uncharacterized protein (TIGR03546 family)
MILGLVPKGNLTALLLCALLFSLRVNKGLALLSAVLFSGIAPWADSFAHKLGFTVLGIDFLQPIYAFAFSLPLGPWLGFHNTVVTGSLILGLYLAYPVYLASGMICTRLSPIVSEWLQRERASQSEGGFDHDPAARAAA